MLLKKTGELEKYLEINNSFGGVEIINSSGATEQRNTKLDQNVTRIYNQKMYNMERDIENTFKLALKK